MIVPHLRTKPKPREMKRTGEGESGCAAALDHFCLGFA